VLNVGGSWIYEEFTGGQGVASLGMEDTVPQAPTSEERNSILDLFKR
jgi:penicillin-binding protein 1A